MENYQHQTIEKKWQRIWEKTGLYRTRQEEGREKFYILDMFPYPSGAGLHVGHPKGYIATDIFARMKVMQGYNVLHPMGWDAFGLPAENFALKNKIHPRASTQKNIDTFKKQLFKLGFSYDWEREINTTNPEFYKWTQWVFLQMFKRGLAYESHEPIIWCPSCKTGLANEDLEGGKCERCGSEVERKPMRQWVLKITDYAERMLQDLEKLPDWEESIKEMQKNWIGRSEGARVKFKLVVDNQTPPQPSPCQGEGAGKRDLSESGKEKSFGVIVPPSLQGGGQEEILSEIEVFTTRPDTLFGATYFVLAPEHPLIGHLESKITNWKEVLGYVKKVSAKSDLERTDLAKDKTGVKIEGLAAVNPVNGKELPIFVADYVLMGYGTGAVMAVPAHDERDWEFAKKYKLPIVEVLKGGNINKEAYTGDGEHINSEFLDGLGKVEGIEKMSEWLEKNNLGGKAVNYKIKDWVFSRQRYWGEPIPLAYCENCKIEAEKIAKENRGTIEKIKLAGNSNFQALNSRFQIKNFSIGELLNPGVVSIDELPVALPEVESYEPSGTGESPLAKIDEWVNIKCPKCGGPAKRETNTMPQWAGSSWYYLRFIDPENGEAIINKEKDAYWSPVDFYVGGAEHATRHLIYARFWHKFLYDIGAVSYDEPFKRLQHVGLIMAEDGRKMSKRWGNVINPDDIVKKHGADAMRVYEMFMGPFSQAVAWNTNGLLGARNFLVKVWNLADKAKEGHQDEKKILALLHKTIKKVGEDIEAFKLNTAVSAMMILANGLERQETISKDVYQKFLLILAPFAPHMAEELFSRLGGEDSIFKETWPAFDPKMVFDEEIELVLQVNGKVRGQLTVPSDISREEAEEQALNSEKIQKWTANKKIIKIIFVPGRLINIVVK